MVFEENATGVICKIVDTNSKIEIKVMYIVVGLFEYSFCIRPGYQTANMKYLDLFGPIHSLADGCREQKIRNNIVLNEGFVYYLAVLFFNEVWLATFQYEVNDLFVV